MALFNLLRKLQEDLADNDISEEPHQEENTSPFKGDLLSKCKNPETKPEPDRVVSAPVDVVPAPIYVAPAWEAKTKDSADSVVFLTFPTAQKRSWVCQDCGTKNDESLNGCVVCGLRR